MTAAQLSAAVSTMQKGDWVIYFTGHLAEAAGKDLATARLRDMAQRLSTMWMSSPTGSMYVGMRMIALSQRRVVEGIEYVATRL